MALLMLEGIHMLSTAPARQQLCRQGLKAVVMLSMHREI